MRIHTENSRFDAIVVGTGPGGATVARELAARGKKVLMLEWGDNRPLTGGTLDTLTRMGIPGKGLYVTPRLLITTRAITTGGSSMYYYSTAFDPPLEMLKAHGIDLRAEVKEIRRELPVNPLPDEWIGPMSKRIMDCACDLGYGWEKLNKFIYADRLHEVSQHSWGFIAAPNWRSKWTARNYVEEAVSHGAVLVNGARVLKILFEGDAAVGVEYESSGRIEREYAGRMIVSAGGIGTPMILRASGMREAGYNYFFDPLIMVLGDVRDMRITPEIPMSTGMHCAEDGYVMTDLHVAPFIYFACNAEKLRFHRLLSQGRTLQIMIKIKDELGGKLGKSGWVKKKLSRNDEQRLLHGYERARKILVRAGAKGIFRSMVFAAHPGGTVKIGEMLDPNLRTKYRNLYVCDCSVIPEAWGLPPTFTLIALGKRLAKHLLGLKN